MSEEGKSLSIDEKDREEDLDDEVKKVFSRRQALLGALFGFGITIAKTAKAAGDSCACLAPPNCDSLCVNGGIPKGNGTQECVCNTEPIKDTSAWEDIIAAGEAGPKADVTMNRNITRTTYTHICSKYGYYGKDDICKTSTPTSIGYTLADLDHPVGTFEVPYFSVDSKGRITSFATHKVTIQNNFTDKTGTKYYYNYSEYYDNNCTDSYD